MAHKRRPSSFILLMMLSINTFGFDSTDRSLELSVNTSSGNSTILLDGRPLVSGVPSMDGCVPAVLPYPKFNPYSWARKVLNSSYNPTTNVYAEQHTWGSWSMRRGFSTPPSNSAGLSIGQIDLDFSVTNTYNETLEEFSLLPWGLYLGGWEFGGCNATAPEGGCSSVNPHSSPSTCHADWNTPQAGGSPECRENDVQPNGIGEVPQILIADFTTGAVVATIVDAPMGLRFGFPWVSGAFRLHFYMAQVNVGETVKGSLSLRFAGAPKHNVGPSDRARSLLGLANDTLQVYRHRFPNTVHWEDRRPIGALFPSDCGASCHCKTLSPQDCPNPRGYNFVVSGSEAGVNVTSAAGIEKFKSDTLKYMNNSVQYCKYGMGGTDGDGPGACQGILVWSLEGQQWPQTTSWVGDPRLLPELSPEMDAAADEMFKLVTNAGMQCGMTLRPQQWTLNPLWNDTVPPMQHPFKYFQRNLLLSDNTSDINGTAQLLIAKASYAYNRWGCTMFYVDTTACDPCPTGVLPAEIWFKVHAALPHCVFFPEESTFAYRSVVAPLQDNWGGNAIATPIAADVLYGRDAWSFQLMQFPPGGSPAGKVPVFANTSLVEQYAALAKRGDAMLVDAWFNNSVNVLVRKAYELANATTPTNDNINVNLAVSDNVHATHSSSNHADTNDQAKSHHSEANSVADVCTTPITISDDPIDLTKIDMGLASRSPTHTVSVVWSGRPLAENFVTVQRCDSININTHTRVTMAQQLRVSVPWHRLPQLRASAIVPAVWSQSVTMCSDGIDNDGDGLIDLVDPGCRGSMANGNEDGEVLAPSNFAWKFGVDAKGGAFLQELTWKGKPVIQDDGLQGNRYFLHGDTGTHTNTQYTSDFELYATQYPPWQPNTTTWKTANAPIASAAFEKGQAVSNVTVLGADTVLVTTNTPHLTVTDVFRFEGDSIYITTNVSLKSTFAIPVAAYFPLVLGNLQLGHTTTGCDCTKQLTVFSAISPCDGHNEAGNCTATCHTGLFHLDRLRHGSLQQGQPWDNTSPGTCCPSPQNLTGWKSIPARGNVYPQSSYSPVTVLGGTADNDFTIGMQVVSKDINPNHAVDGITVEYYDVPAAPKHPLLSQYMFVPLARANVTSTFTTIVTLGPPSASWVDPSSAVTQALQPYAKYFASTFGSTPVYCPSGAVVMRFSETTRFNRSTHTYAPGSSLWSDDINSEQVLSSMVAGGFNKLFVWDGQIDGALLSTSFGGANFNPNADVLDPNIDAVCDDAIFKNATRGVAKAGVSLAWYGRPRMTIMQSQDPTKAATVECPSKMILMGEGVNCNLTDFSSPCTLAQFAIIDRLVGLGVAGFYWDEYLAMNGRLTFVQAVLKKYPHLYILGEQGVDVDSLLVYGLPWMVMPPGVWDPPFEPSNSVLQKIISPHSTTIVGVYGADNNDNHTTFSLKSSKGTSLMVLTDNVNTSATCNCHPANTTCWCPNIWKHRVRCEQMQLSSENAAWRFQQYGKHMPHCVAPPIFDAKAMKCNNL